MSLGGMTEAQVRDALWQLERMDYVEGKAPTLADAVRALRGLEPIKLSEKEIANAATGRGGFTRDQLALWGVPWPPPRGWKQALLRGEPIPKP